MKNPIFEKLSQEQTTRTGFLNAFSTLSASLTDELFKENKKTSDLVKGVNQKNLNQLLEDTKALFNQIEELTITVAFTPDDETILALGKFARQQIGNKMMINLKTDPKILAGAIISKNGQEKNYSWQKKLSESHEEVSKVVFAVKESLTTTSY